MLSIVESASAQDSGAQGMPALRAALASFEEQQAAGRGNQDFSTILVYR